MKSSIIIAIAIGLLIAGLVLLLDDRRILGIVALTSGAATIAVSIHAYRNRDPWVLWNRQRK